MKEPKAAFFSSLSGTHSNSHTLNICGCLLLLAQRHSACHVRLHNSTVHLLYKYCTNCTVCNWTVLTVITQKLLLHVQVNNSTAHLLYKYCTNCTVCNRTVLTVITQMHLLHVQLHNSTQTVQRISLLKQSAAGCLIMCVCIQIEITSGD